MGKEPDEKVKEKKTDQQKVEEKQELAKPDELIQKSTTKEEEHDEPAPEPSEPSEPVEDVVAAAKPKPPILHAKELLD